MWSSALKGGGWRGVQGQGAGIGKEMCYVNWNCRRQFRTLAKPTLFNNVGTFAGRPINSTPFTFIAKRSLLDDMKEEENAEPEEDVPMAAKFNERAKRVATKAYLEQKERKRSRRLIKKEGTPIDLPRNLSIKGLSALLGVKSVEIVKLLLKLGITPKSSSEYLQNEIVDLIVEEYGRVPNRDVKNTGDILPRPKPTASDKFPKKPPTVVILGHVNHGKTTLLDAFRNSAVKIVDGEAGGITQRIAAFSVPVGETTITFLDTPGHAAFERMRERGATVADLAIVVVDAERGVQPQTLTSINYVKTFDIPTVVALNKMDKQSARPNKTKTQLIEAGLRLEDSDEGGEVPVVKISALHQTGLLELKETIQLMSELHDIKADRTGPAEVTILESRLDKNRGVVTSGIVKCGTLKPGAYLVSGTVYGKVRWMYDSTGARVEAVLPGFPVEFTGFSDKESFPVPGDVAIEVPTEKRAKEITLIRNHVKNVQFKDKNEILTQERLLREEEEIELARLYAIENGIDEEEYVQKVIEERETKEELTIPVIVKGDVGGSIEAIKAQIERLPKDELNVTVVRTGIGNITDSDVKMADTGKSKAIIIGFDVKAPESALRLAQSSGVIVNTFSVIYTLMDWLRAYCSTKLPPEVVWVDTAGCLIQEVFEIKVKSKKVKIAGCLVESGTIKRGADVQVRQEGTDKILYTGKIRQLRHIKQDVKLVASGKECGIMLTDNFGDFEAGDRIYSVEREERKRVFDPQT